MSLKHRAEIDGLRTLAVVPVVLFHAGFDVFSGGFVGVDIFFVISGFLISSIIISEVNSGIFTFSSFYARRVRRILPALSVVVFVSLVASIFVALPDQVISTSQSAVAALFGVSNFLFWSQSGYFSPASEFSILLHTWSLGVEEQFYLFLPFFVLLVYRLRWSISAVIAIFLPLGFLIGFWLSFNKPSVAFYLLPARAWELGVGVALAAGLVPKSHSDKLNSALAILGVSVIVVSIFSINQYMAFPGWVALLPCLGAAAVIHSASPKNIVGRALSIAPVRFVGLISYSLYLWHWPVFVFLRMWFSEPKLSAEIAFVGIVVSFVLAAITWKFIENPFRSRQVLPFKGVIGVVGMVMVLVVGLAVASLMGNGWPNRLDDEAKRLLLASDDIDPLRDRCAGIHELDDLDCRFGDKEAALDFVLIGDSHAGAIRPAIESWAQASGRAGTILWMRACPMLLGATEVPNVGAGECRRFRENVLDILRTSSGIKTVFLAGRWERSYSGIAPEIGGAFRTYLVDDQSHERNADATKEVFERALISAAEEFESLGSQVILLGAVPDIGFDVPRVLALAAYNGAQEAERTVDRAGRESLPEELDGVFDRVVAAGSNRTYISIWRSFCDPDCKLIKNGIPLYSDDDHMTFSAANAFVGPVVKKELTAKGLGG